MKLTIEQIEIKDRIREDIGDIEPLKKSMEKYGLLNPITVNSSNQLIAGFRRLMAAKALGWEEIECNCITIESELDKLIIEAEENSTRKDFTPDELEKFNRRREYLSMSFFEKIIFHIKRFFRKIFDWLKDLFSTSE